MTLLDGLKKMALQKAIENFLRNLKKDRGKMEFLAGIKTYIIAALLLLLGGMSALGMPVPGFDMEPGAAITTALGLIFARGGAKNDIKRVTRL